LFDSLVWAVMGYGETTTATTIDEVKLPETTNVATVLYGRRDQHCRELLEVK